MKHYSFIVVLSLAATLLFSCNEIDNVGFDAASAIDQQIVSKAPSINVTHNEAQGIADRFMRSEAGNLGVATKSSTSKRVSSSAAVREDGQDLMYIFNYEDGGFVIVGSTRNYYPILAYSDKGSFELQDDMGPVDVWLDETKVGIKSSGSLDEATKTQMQNLWARYDGTYVDPAQQLLAARRPQTRSAGEDSCWAEIERLQAQYGSEGWTFSSLSNAEYYFNEWGYDDLYDAICSNAAQNHSDPSETVIGYIYPTYYHIGPLLSTQWHQDFPFNDLCPSHYPAGCTAIAAGQIMKFFEYPTNMSWSNTPFTWNQISADPDSSSLSRQPHLIRMLGQKFQMTYGQSGSSANISNVIAGLDSLGYIELLPKVHNYDAAKDTLLNCMRPFIMTGTDGPVSSIWDILNVSGHYWVCDGVNGYSNQMVFYTENQPYGAGTFTQGMYSHNNPGIEGGTIFSYYLHMNWCFDKNHLNCNGWFVKNDYDSGNGDYQYTRYNIYLKKP
jgi:hypothetical protein